MTEEPKTLAEVAEQLRADYDTVHYEALGTVELIIQRFEACPEFHQRDVEVKMLRNAFIPLANIGLADTRSAEVLLAIVRQHARRFAPTEAQA